MDPQERKTLVEELAQALAARRLTDRPEAADLLELMQTEQNLIQALGVVRRQIARIVSASEPPSA